MPWPIFTVHRWLTEVEEGEISSDGSDLPKKIAHSCLICKELNLPVDEGCIRVVKVQAHPIGKSMSNTVLTFASENDILPPKVCMYTLLG